MLSDLAINLIASAIFFIIQLFLIDRIIKSIFTKRDKNLWLPFRSLYFKSINDYYEGLIKISSEWLSKLQLILYKIKKEHVFKEEDLIKIKEIHKDIASQLEKGKTEFYFIIQTVSPSIVPSSAPYCNQVMVFSNILGEYLAEAFKRIDEINVDRIADKNYSSEKLNGIYTILLGVEVIVMYRFSKLGDNLKNSIAENEKLFYHNGYFLHKNDFDYASHSKKIIEDYKQKSATIERKMPVKNFFDD